MCKSQARGRSLHISYKLFCTRLKQVNFHACTCKISARSVYAGIAADIYIRSIEKFKNLSVRLTGDVFSIFKGELLGNIWCKLLADTVFRVSDVKNREGVQNLVLFSFKTFSLCLDECQYILCILAWDIYQYKCFIIHIRYPLKFFISVLILVMISILRL